MGLRSARRRQRPVPCSPEGGCPAPSAPREGMLGGRLARRMGSRGREGSAFLSLPLLSVGGTAAPGKPRESELSPWRDRVHDTSLPKGNVCAFIMW